MTPDPAVGRATAIRAALATLAPPGVSVGVRRIAARDELSLHDVEREFMTSASDKRRHEFATGRALLRDLLARDVAIAVGPDRRPVMPVGVHASVAHDDHVAVGAIAYGGFEALGIDIERRGELEPDAVQQILRTDDTVADPILAFVLKEAAYKAWSNLGGRMLDHKEVRVTVTDRAFTARVIPDGVEFAGRFAAADDAWLALVADARHD